MAKNRNKKKKAADSAMDISTPIHENLPEAMDTTETTAPKLHGVLNRKIKKGVPVRRSKNVRKMKAIEKAISRIEKKEEKIVKNEDKTLRTKSAKTLYE